MDIYKKLECGKERVALRLFALPDEYSAGIKFCVDVVFVKDMDKNYTESMGFYHNYIDEKHQYKGLCVSGYSFNRKDEPSDFEVHIREAYSNHETTLEKAEQMVRVLKPINRKMVRIEIEQGYQPGFEEYICRLASILKAKSFYHKSITQENDITEYRVDDISLLKKAITNMIAFNTTINPEKNKEKAA